MFDPMRARVGSSFCKNGISAVATENTIFGDTKYSSAEIEMTYYEMAIKSGIDMMPSRLYEIEGNGNFITKRFDRDGERKLHTQTLQYVSCG